MKLVFLDLDFKKRVKTLVKDIYYFFKCDKSWNFTFVFSV